MGTLEIVDRWTRYLKTDVLPGVTKPLREALSLFSLALVEVCSCSSGRISQAAHSKASIASKRRRWERWLHNPHFDAKATQCEIAKAVWQNWHGTRAPLLIDETSRGEHLRCLKVSLAYRKRALPLAFVCYRPHRPPGGMVKLLNRLLAQALEHAPPRVEIVVIADRGLSWPSLLDACVSRGCHFLLRLQGTTVARFPDGRKVHVKDLVRRPGCKPWLGPVEVFQKAKWRSVSLVALWSRGCKEPWLLITDESACAGRWRTYARRMWIEESFRDDKSHGFQWGKSRVDDPKHATRLLVVLALAALLALSLGTWLIKSGLRHEIDPRRERRLSVFQLGLQALSSILAGLRPKWPLVFSFHAT